MRIPNRVHPKKLDGGFGKQTPEPRMLSLAFICSQTPRLLEYNNHSLRGSIAIRNLLF
jgi:hypothetical protein